MLCHDAGSAAKDRPGQKRTNKSITKADPCGGNPKIPAKLSGIAHKNNGRKVGRAVGEGGKPGADRTAAENKAVDVCTMPPGIGCRRQA